MKLFVKNCFGEMIRGINQKYWFLHKTYKLKL